MMCNYLIKNVNADSKTVDAHIIIIFNSAEKHMELAKIDQNSSNIDNYSLIPSSNRIEPSKPGLIIKNDAVNNSFIQKPTRSSGEFYFNQMERIPRDQADFVTSLEAKLLNEHKYCFFYSIKNYFDQLKPEKQLQVKGNRFYSHCSFCLQDYLQDLQSLIPPTDVQDFIDYLQAKPTLNSFMKYVFKTASPLIMDETILVAYRIGCFYRKMQDLQLRIDQLQILVNNSLFVRSIYSDDNLTLLIHSRIQLKGDCTMTKQQLSILQFMRAYALTILAVTDGYFMNPQYERIKQKRQKLKIQKRLTRMRCLKKSRRFIRKQTKKNKIIS